MASDVMFFVTIQSWFVIFLYVLFLLVLCYTCVEEACDGTVEFDGLELPLLNMGSYLISYEVLRDFMFHFLKGRYMYNHVVIIIILVFTICFAD